MIYAPLRMRARLGLPDLGIGIGLRAPHARRISDEHPAIDWLECISENYMVDGGAPLAELDRARAAYPIVLHGVSLDLGGTDPLRRDYLARLRALVDRVGPPWASDHACWSGARGKHLHELLPLPMTRAVAAHVAERAREVQDVLGVRFAIENVSSYLTFEEDELPEHEFIALVAESADCGILLDVNNVYVSSRNHGFDAERYLDAIPAERVVQIHLAGHTDMGAYLLDTHARPVCDAVWALYERACARIGPCSTLIEWDDELPALEVLVAEVARARAVRNRATP